MISQRLEGDGLVAQVYEISEDQENIHSCDVSSDGEYLVCAFGNGILRVIRIGEGAQSLLACARVGPGKPYNDMPCTAVRWFPRTSDDAPYMVASASCEGGVFLWEWDGESLTRVKLAAEPKNEIAALDVSPTGSHILTAGSDKIVRLYESDLSNVEELTIGVDENNHHRVTHANRIFSARFMTSTLAVSAGWGSPAQIWDLRTLRSERYIAGGQVSCDAIEPVPSTSLVLIPDSSGGEVVGVYDCITATRMERDSQRISAAFEDGQRLKLVRMCPTTQNLWCLSNSSSEVFVVSYATGQRIGSIKLPKAPTNIALSSEHPGVAFVSCQGSTLIILRHKS